MSRLLKPGLLIRRLGSPPGAALGAVLLAVLLAAAPAAADNTGDWYDNRDDGHTHVNLGLHPGAQLMASGSGAQLLVVEGRVVVGNASLAITRGPYVGSLPRSVVLTTAFGAGAVYRQYTANNAYWYPEHRDHDTVDQFHAMSPCISVSQGSSGSEIDEVHKWLYTLAAFPAATKERLGRTGLLMPTVQMLSRRTRVASDVEYLSGAAHPSAFDDADNRAAMEAMARSMPPDRIPPLVRLRVLEDDYDGVPGVDFFEADGVAEALFDTPASIARVFRGRQRSKHLTVSAEDSFDADDRPLSFRWSVLRGDPAAVRVEPLGPTGSRARIEVDYHPTAVVAGTARTTNLVVVGAFAHNGHYWSAPAFVTSFTLPNEARTYDSPSGRLLRIDYSAAYVHPALSTAKSWLADALTYSPGGELLGWVRSDAAGGTTEFTAAGSVVTAGSLAGGVLRTRRAVYSLDAQASRLVWTATDEEPAPVVAITVRQTASRCDGLDTAVAISADCAFISFDLLLAHDPAVLALRSISPAGPVAALRGGQGPEVWDVDLEAPLGGCGAVLAAGSVRMVASLADPGDAVLPPAAGADVAVLVYDRAPGADAAASTRIAIPECGGTPAVRCAVWGAVRPPATAVEVVLPRPCEESFVRGDCNADGMIGIADALFLLLDLFEPRRRGGQPGCRDACDGDDDGILNLTDAIVLLISRFHGGAELPPPHPRCGTDQSPDRLGCGASAECP